MKNKKITLVIALVLIVGAVYYLESGKVQVDNSSSKEADVSVMPKEEKAKLYKVGQEISTPDSFINTAGQPVKIQDYIGKKVVLVDFWTYSCINCQRTLPYINDWYKKYADKGLEIIGIHTPEFEFEKEYQNVLAAIQKFKINYPVVLDNDYSTWNSYENHYWPRKYLIDIDGYIVYDHIGEGGYAETESKIQELLNERMAVLGERGSVSEELSGSIGEDILAQSPETYFGSGRNELLGNGKAGVVGEQDFVAPSEVLPNKLYLSGRWDVQSEFARSVNAGAKIIYKYSAGKVFLVAESGEGTIIRVKRDGKIVSELAGSDLKDGQVSIKEAGLYRLVEGDDTLGHVIEIEVIKGNLDAYTFTFG